MPIALSIVWGGYRHNMNAGDDRWCKKSLLHKEKNMRNLRKMCHIYFLLFTFLVAFHISPLHADENDVRQSTDSGTITNTAQDQHAQNLAEDAALRDPKVSSLNEYKAYAEQELKEATLSEDQQRIDAAQKAYASAKANYEDALAKEISETREEMAAMREQGMGWGEIAHKFGVHPGVLGLGHEKKEQNQEQAREQEQTTSRSASDKAGKSKGLGLGHAADAGGEGKGKGSSAGHGGGNSGGNSGGNGGGNGGGHGGGGGNK